MSYLTINSFNIYLLRLQFNSMHCVSAGVELKIFSLGSLPCNKISQKCLKKIIVIYSTAYHFENIKLNFYCFIITEVIVNNVSGLTLSFHWRIPELTGTVHFGRMPAKTGFINIRRKEQQGMGPLSPHTSWTIKPGNEKHFSEGECIQEPQRTWGEMCSPGPCAPSAPMRSRRVKRQGSDGRTRTGGRKERRRSWAFPSCKAQLRTVLPDEVMPARPCSQTSRQHSGVGRCGQTHHLALLESK